MNPTPQDYERLGRTLYLARGDDPDNWEEEAIDDDNDLVDTTRETLDDWRQASKNWREPGQRQEVNEGLYWAECQAIKGQRRCEVCLVDCGEFRLVFQC